MTTENDKKALLLERKRHTARCVASTCYAVPMGEGTPSLSWPEVSHPVLARGVPHLGLGYLPAWDWVRPGKNIGPVEVNIGWRWGTLRKWQGTSGSIMGCRWGTPLWTERHLWKQYIRNPSDTSGKYKLLIRVSCDVHLYWGSSPQTMAITKPMMTDNSWLYWHISSSDTKRKVVSLVQLTIWTSICQQYKQWQISWQDFCDFATNALKRVVLAIKPEPQTQWTTWIMSCHSIALRWHPITSIFKRQLFVRVTGDRFISEICSASLSSVCHFSFLKSTIGNT